VLPISFEMSFKIFIRVSFGESSCNDNPAHRKSLRRKSG